MNKGRRSFKGTGKKKERRKQNAPKSLGKPQETVKPRPAFSSSRPKSPRWSRSPVRIREAAQRYQKWAGKDSLLLALGMTCPNRNCFAVNPISGTAVYPASGVVVLLNTLGCKQKGYIQASKQCISCVNFSPDGQYILLGEQGRMPALKIWSMAFDKELADLKGHQYGVAFAAFSGNMDLLVSLGTNHDGYIFVWSWPSTERIFCNKFAESIYAMSFSRMDPFFVTCGLHHIRFWYPDTESSRNDTEAPVALLGRSVIMQDKKTRTYVDLAFGEGASEKFVYCVSDCGLICKINSERQVINFLKLQKTELTSVQASDNQLFVGTLSGHVHFLNAITMQYKFTISVPLDASFISDIPKQADLTREMKDSKPRGKMYLGVDSVHKQLTALLDNGELCIWDISNPKSAKKKFFASGHNKVISSLDSCCLRCLNKQEGPSDTIFSVAHDGTMRQWKLSADFNVSSTTTNALYSGNYDSHDPATCNTEVITVIKVNEEIKMIVAGDSKGFLSVYDAVTLELANKIMGHFRGITVLAFSIAEEGYQRSQLLLSGGRDRSINVYDITKDFQLLNSLCLHSSSISALATVQIEGRLELISAALDRIVLISNLTKTAPHQFTCIPHQCRRVDAPVIDIRICPKTHWVMLGKSNAMVTIINMYSSQSVSSFHACKDPKASLEKLCLDTTGAILVTACSDRSINLLSVPLGHHLACLTGHANPVSGLAVTSDMYCLVSSSRDGCIFIWKLPARVRQKACSLFMLAVRKARLEAKKVCRPSNFRSRSSIELSVRPTENSKATSPICFPRGSCSSVNINIPITAGIPKNRAVVL